MQVLTVRMDRVYDVHLDSFSRHMLWTLFSFDSNGRRYVSLSVDGEPVLKSGQTITAVLRRSDDWQTLEGIRIHETGEICARSPSGYIRLMLLTCFFAVVWYMQLKFDHPELLTSVLAGFVLLASFFGYRAYHCNRIIRMLRLTV